MNPVFAVLSCLTLFAPARAATTHATDTVGLRKALTAILNLNDGELRSLLTGEQVSTVAQRLPPDTQFFLKASSGHLNELQQILNAEGSPLSAQDFKIAKRRKSVAQSYPQSADSLLGALADLSANLQANHVPRSRERRSHGHRRQSHSHGEYWLQAGHCKKQTDLLCPSPNKHGDWSCTEDMSLCDGQNDCPNGEDENPDACLFYKSIRNEIDLVVDELIKAVRRG